MSATATVPLAHKVQTPEGVAVQWTLRRNCSLTPRQVLFAYVALCLFNGAIGLGFAALGYPMVTLFVLIEMAAVGTALFVYARHACDHETLTLRQGMLAIDQHDGTHVRHIDLQACWVCVEPSDGPDALVALCERGHCVEVGRHLPPQLRAAMVRELRVALRDAQAGPPRSR